MKLREIMVSDVIQAEPDETIGAAATHARKTWRCLVVTVAGAVTS